MVEKAKGISEDWLALWLGLFIFILSRRFTDDHNLCQWITNSEHKIRSGLMEIAFSAVFDKGFQHRKIGGRMPIGYRVPGIGFRWDRSWKNGYFRFFYYFFIVHW